MLSHFLFRPMLIMGFNLQKQCSCVFKTSKYRVLQLSLLVDFTNLYENFSSSSTPFPFFRTHGTTVGEFDRLIVWGKAESERICPIL